MSRANEREPLMPLRSFVSRIAAAALVFLLGILGAAFGGGTSNYPELGDESPLAWIYFSASLFFFGGTDLGVPLKGASETAYVVLWAVYFLAPLLTTSVIADAIIGIIGRREEVPPQIVQPTIIIGTGQIASGYLDAIREIAPDRHVLLFEHRIGIDETSINAPSDGGVVWRGAGNLTNRGTRQILEKSQPSSILVMTDDDLFNLECAWGLAASCPDIPVNAHVAELSLLRPVHRILRANRDIAAERAPAIFSTNRMAVLHLYDEHIEPRLQDTHAQDDFVIAGFGHLGQTLAELLLGRGREELARLFIVDPDAILGCRRFDADQGTDQAIQGLPIEGALDDPATWETLVARLGENSDGETVATVLLTDEVHVNLRAAVLLRERFPELRVLALCPSRQTFLDTLAAQIGIDIFYLEEMLAPSFRDHYEAVAFA